MNAIQKRIKNLCDDGGEYTPMQIMLRGGHQRTAHLHRLDDDGVLLCTDSEGSIMHIIDSADIVGLSYIGD